MIMITSVLVVLLSLTGVDTSCLTSHSRPQSNEVFKTPGGDFTAPQYAFQHTPSFTESTLWPSVTWMAP